MSFVVAAGLLEPYAGLIFWKAIAFGLLLFILYRFAWGPITKALTEREQNIDMSLRKAEEALAEARQIQADNARARREAEQDAQRILREAREAAEKLRTEEIERTRAQIRQMQEQAQAEIEREKQGALQALRAEVADLAIQAAEKILAENLDPARQRRLVDDFINQLPRN
ncbi:MAG: ATP synthase F0 subunit B [Bacteroidetes bacterium]|nr:MAG: ATP synthase F0 subunit B [Bacteroidota bacterium]